MNLKKLGRTFWVIAAVAIMAMVLQGCGGDDGVSPSTHMDVEEERDMYKAQAEELQEDLDEATDEAERLQGELTTATTSLTAATMRIGSAPDANGMGGSGLLGDLATQMAMVASLTMQINGDGTPDNPGLAAQLQTAMDRIGEQPGPDGTGGSGLLGDLADAMADVTMYMEMINGDGTPENPGLQAQLDDANDDLDAANARIASLLKGEDPDQITPIAGGARTAATDARTAATKADEYADQAEMDDDNRATIQTGDANSVAHAMYARAEADKADEEAGKAETATTMAEAATTTADANKYMNMATAAKEAAETAMGEAKSHAETAATDATMELKIDGTMKSVGDTTIDADAPNNVVTTGTGATAKTVDTGLQEAANPEHTVDAVAGVEFVAGDGGADPPVADTAYVQAVAARTFDIGKVVDSADDTARLAIITQYAGSKNVKVFAYNEADPDVNITTNARTGTEMGKITVENNSSADVVTAGNHVNNTPLRSLGMYYLAGAATDTDGLANTDEVGAEAEGMAVYSYLDFGADRVRGGTDDTTTYLVMDSKREADGTTTYVYRSVDITALASDATTEGTAEEVEITTMIPEATDYDHIHFGVWAALGEDGMTPSAHGIGFVQNYSGEGMTAVMPNFGGATFNGNWVATVQVADPDGNGDISIEDGTAVVTADFEDDDIMVNLMGLAMLEGDISDNTFSGTKATVGDDNTHRLTGDADFTGSFEGAFFGVGAAEAGGVFSFGSDDDNEDGAFAGAFGGAR